jgi:hypothetical protein
MTHDTHTATERTPYDRMRDALADPDRLFTHAEMVWTTTALIAAALGWERERVAETEGPDPLSYAAGVLDGYRQRVQEENAAYPPPPIFSVGAWYDRAKVRAELADDRTQRYAGGPVPAWESSRPDLPDLGPSAARWHPKAGIPLARRGRELVWAQDAS